MNLPAISHRTSDNYCYAVNEDQLIINLKTGYDVVSVELVYADPFEGGIMGGKWHWQGQRLAIPFKKNWNSIFGGQQLLHQNLRDVNTIFISNFTMDKRFVIWKMDFWLHTI